VGDLPTSERSAKKPPGVDSLIHPFAVLGSYVWGLVGSIVLAEVGVRRSEAESAATNLDEAECGAHVCRIGCMRKLPRHDH
jgi:hypothetical protein